MRLMGRMEKLIIQKKEDLGSELSDETTRVSLYIVSQTTFVYTKENPTENNVFESGKYAQVFHLTRN